MRLRRPVAALLGLVTVAPLALLGLLLTVWVPRLFSFGQPGGIGEAEYFALFDRVYLGVAGLALGTAVLVTGYVVYAQRAAAVPPAKRALWTVLLLLGPLGVMPAFWYLYVWRPAAAEE